MRDQTRDYTFAARLTQQYLPDGFYSPGPNGEPDRLLRTHGASVPLDEPTRVLSADDQPLTIFTAVLDYIRAQKYLGSMEDMRIWRDPDMPGLVFFGSYNYYEDPDEAVLEAWNRGVDLFDWTTLTDIEVEHPNA